MNVPEAASAGPGTLPVTLRGEPVLADTARNYTTDPAPLRGVVAAGAGETVHSPPREGGTDRSDACETTGHRGKP